VHSGKKEIINPMQTPPIFLWKGLIIGFSIAAPVGPIGVLCIRRTLINGRFSGFISGLGAATADAIYGTIAALGLAFITNLLVAQETWLRLLGGLFLCYLGYINFSEKPGKINHSIEILSSNKRSDRYRSAYLADYASTLLLTLTNPLTILSFIAIFGGLGLAEPATSPWAALALITGVFCGSVLWWFLLSTAANLFREKFLTPTGLQWVNRISGAVIFSFGVAALVSLLQ
jgi:threonine/homoserine/homoserine lactone efflux protein